jgi:hypothetical protein
MRIGVLISYGTGATQCQIHDLRVEEVVPGVMIEDGAVTADKIAANAVTADKILANQVTTAKLAAGAVTVDKMQVGGANLINDPGFEFSYAPWVSGWSSFSTHSVPTIASGGYSGLKYAVLPGTPAGGGTWIKSAPFLVAAEEKLYVSCRAARVGTPSVGYNAYITMYIYQPDGSTYITQAVHLIGSAIGTSAWELHGFEVTVPAAAGIGIVSFELQGGDGCYIAVDDFRCVKMTDASLIVSGAITTDKLDAGAVTAAKIGANQVTAGKLEANMVISNVVSTAPDTAVPGANPRVVLDASTIPLWIGSGAKTLANAKLQFDTTTGELLIRGVLNASVLDFDDFVTLGVRGSAGKLSMAMAVARSTQFGALTNLTDYVELSATHQYYSPGYGVESGAYARIQVADQPLEFDYCGEITNLNFTDVTYAVYLRYRYDEGTPSVPSWSAYSYYQLPTTTVNKVAPARAATIVPSSRNFAGGAHLKFKASGWQRVDLTLVIKQISGVTHASNLQAVGSVKLMLINLGVGDFTEGYYLLT